MEYYLHTNNASAVFMRAHTVVLIVLSLLAPYAVARDQLAVSVDEARAALRQVNRTLSDPSSHSRGKPVVAAKAREPQKVYKKRPARTKVKATKRSQARWKASSASLGHQLGLNKVRDELKLRSSVAYVLDPETHEVLFSKNEQVVLPIASLTKLMTALVINDQDLDMNEVITITKDDVDRLKNSRSRLRVGSKLTRKQLLHLALMSSENRAAHALGRTYPGGLDRFVENMNAKAALLGMTSSTFVEPTGLSSDNKSNARDLARLVSVAATRPLLRELSTDEDATVKAGRQRLAYHNTNALVRSDRWDIALQKTGYIKEAGRCLVMKAQLAERSVIMVFLDSVGKNSRLGDANRVRHWLESSQKVSQAQLARANNS